MNYHRNRATRDMDYPRVVTVCRAGTDNKDDVSLLFAKREAIDRLGCFSDDEIIQLMLHPEVSRLFGDTFYACREAWADAPEAPEAHPISIGVDPTGLPRALDPDCEPIFFRDGDFIVKTTIGDIYDTCREMQKFIDCKACQHLGRECLFMNLPRNMPVLGVGRTVLEPRQLRFPDIPVAPERYGLRYDFWTQALERSFDYESWKNMRFRAWEATIAGYTVIPAIATDADVPKPGVRAVRWPFEHNFTNIEWARDALSERSLNGVNTRKTIREQCAKCYFGGTVHKYGRSGQTVVPCQKWRPRHCEHGAWENEEQIIELTLKLYEKHLETAPFSLEDVWRVGHLAGIPFKAKHPHTNRPREYIVQRLVAHYSPHSSGNYDWRILVMRNPLSASGAPSLEYGNVASFLASLPEFMRERWESAPPINRRRLALAIQLNVSRNARGYTTSHQGGFGWHCPDIRYVSVHGFRGVEMGYGGASYASTRGFDDMKEIHDYFDGLPFFNTYDAEVGSGNLSVWVR